VPKPGRTTSPGELDLQLVDVAELDLDLEIDLVGHAHGDATAVPLELDRVVAGQGVRQGVEPGGGLLADRRPVPAPPRCPATRRAWDTAAEKVFIQSRRPLEFPPKSTGGTTRFTYFEAA